MKYNKILILIIILVVLDFNRVKSKSLTNYENIFGYKTKFSDGTNGQDQSNFNDLATEFPPLLQMRRNVIWKSRSDGQNRNIFFPTIPPSKSLKWQNHQRIPSDEYNSKNCNDHSNINSFIHPNCNTRLPTPTSAPQIPNAPAAGINCRRVMNSELNELGEIIDSVTIVCDPPTTTSRPTRKPFIKTTLRTTTTTRKPLVKVCGPVMDSYINEKGEIVDSVTIVCEMKEMN
ncbi:uncharacterized protein ACRADG_007091 [Cochliomyia hominivorax]